jgi:hypothetical protein
MSLIEEKPRAAHFEETAGHDDGLRPVGTRQTQDTEKASYADSETGLAHKAGMKKAERRLLLKLGEFGSG